MQLKDKKILTAIGAMSGTSMDGIDLALIKSDGRGFVERGASTEFPFEAEFREKLQSALVEAKALKKADERTESLLKVEEEFTQLHVEAISKFLTDIGAKSEEIDLVGFHGQTVLHRPDIGLTVQLGDGQSLANQIGIPVVHDMRSNDMKHGGQGAPLIPIYHQALAKSLPCEFRAQYPIVFVNIGGISNISYITSDKELIAFDVGPGNALLDQWIGSRTDFQYDKDGDFASKGTVNPSIVEHYLSDSFFEKPIPKSLDRNDFSTLINSEISAEDGARTLAHITAASIMKSQSHLPEPSKLWIICGGGRKHPMIMQDLNSLANEHGNEVVTAEEVGLDGDAMEAEAWGYLAIRSLKNMPLTYPLTTGCNEPVSGGILNRAKD